MWIELVATTQFCVIVRLISILVPTKENVLHLSLYIRAAPFLCSPDVVYCDYMQRSCVLSVKDFVFLVFEISILTILKGTMWKSFCQESGFQSVWMWKKYLDTKTFVLLLKGGCKLNGGCFLLFQDYNSNGVFVVCFWAVTEGPSIGWHQWLSILNSFTCLFLIWDDRRHQFLLVSFLSQTTIYIVSSSVSLFFLIQLIQF